jgi:hypothetical protein
MWASGSYYQVWTPNFILNFHIFIFQNFQMHNGFDIYIYIYNAI